MTWFNNQRYRVSLLSFGLLSIGLGPVAALGQTPAPTPQIKMDEDPCGKPEEALPISNRRTVYKDMPFQPGEVAQYEIAYMGVHAGFGTLTVGAPQRFNDIWHRVFKADLQTGEWYESIFELKDSAQAISRPWDFGVSKFYIEQDEGNLFSKRYIRKKWIDFDHKNCKAAEREQKPGKPEKNREFTFFRGYNDALGAYYHLRTKNFVPGKKIYIPVYTSEKNWLLEALPLQMEDIKVPAGEFKAMKIKLQTYLGQLLQQKGDIHIWIADTPERPLIQVEAEIKIGSLWMRMKSFQPGREL